MYMETSKQMAIKTFFQLKLGPVQNLTKETMLFITQSPVIKITAFHIFNKILQQHNLKENIFFSLTLLTCNNDTSLLFLWKQLLNPGQEIPYTHAQPVLCFPCSQTPDLTHHVITEPSRS